MKRIATFPNVLLLIYQEIKEVKGSLPDFLSEAAEALNAAAANSPVDSPERETQSDRQVPYHHHLPSFAAVSPSNDDVSAAVVDAAAAGG